MKLSNLWKSAIFFVSFEIIFWKFGNSCFFVLEDVVLKLSFWRLDTFGEIANFLVGVLFIIFSIYCFKQFIYYLMQELKSIINEIIKKEIRELR